MEKTASIACAFAELNGLPYGFGVTIVVAQGRDP